MDSPINLDAVFPTLFSKTFFIVSAQLFITWLTTHIAFEIFKRIDTKFETANPYVNLQQPEDVFVRMAEDTNPRYRWVFSWPFFLFIVFANMAVFLVLLFWGIDQTLSISFALFSAWSVLMGIELEYVLLNVEEGLGRKVLALTATVVLAAALIGIYSHVDFGFLQLPLFIALNVLLLFSVYQMFRSMSEVKQRILAGFGVGVFTLYLVVDFGLLKQKQNIENSNTWPDAMNLAMKIYLDIINLFLQLLKLLSKSHH
jgi:FtsH-binding integral membrane protein